ncbi:RHS repeat-associated core domain-containing protein [Pseudoxanthomonas sp. LH2527]|uniref:RHS repeat domain-containing protein n=1 Tax=Pseudoxanthomonas sp. LH2527 TaxID=2923249 RepID=UPI001F12D2FD|nr:RHS repeat-associated core domain-containing protein [Pseudoxanthomonas sp. LH2527]MCH6484869.1 RHS repeat-associated core domain-containing protein [Pseudoxanthomonas sp. LH2527]
MRKLIVVALIAMGQWAATESAVAQTVVEYLHTDALGSPVAVTNQAGTVIERSDYEPYGAVIGKPNYQGIGYTGHVQDAATGLTYMQQRYYDPQVGLFLSVDPVTAHSEPVGMFNRYRYANNNPYRFTDPDGRITKEMKRQGFEEIGGRYAVRVDSFNLEGGESRFEVHVYRDTKGLAKAVESGNLSDVRALEVNTLKQDGSWGKHGKPSEAPDLGEEGQKGLNKVVQRELTSRGMVVEGPDKKLQLREHLRRNLGGYGRYLGPAGVMLEYTRSSLDRACEVHPSDSLCK